MSVLAIVNARLLDPASDYDGPGAVLIEHGRIKVEETRQTISQVRPGRIVHQTRLHI